jgi:cytidylate kinase
MSLHTYLDQGVSIFHAHLQSPRQPAAPGVHVAVQPFITLSRETGAGATTIGRKLLPLLDDAFSDGERSWAFLDKDLLLQALTHHQLPARLATFLPEDRISEVQAAIGELVGLHPPLWELEQKVADAILSLAKNGRVIFAGRAAHLITRNLAGGLHVRLVASRESRVRRMAELLQCEPASAADHVAKTDQARRRFLQANFGQQIDDPHLYDLVINTDRVAPDAAARLILSAVQDRVCAERMKQAGFSPLPRLTKEQLTPLPFTAPD